MWVFSVFVPSICLFLLPRNARLLAASELREWELESEPAPADEVRFWKLTAAGGVHAVTVPDALFAEKRTRRESEGGDQEQQRHMSATSGSRSKNKGTFPTARSEERGANQQQEQRDESKTIGTDIAHGSDGTKKRSQPKYLEAHDFGPAEANVARQGDVGDDAPTPSERNTAVREDRTSSPPKVDRFGRKIKIARHGDRQKVTRLGGPPEGTLLALGWGWGGEFRIGTGRDGFEVHPTPLHPYFKVRGCARYLAVQPRFEECSILDETLAAKKLLPYTV